MPVKETLTESEAQELADVVQNRAFLSMTVKSSYWNENSITFCPIIRVQSKADLTKFQQKYGGSLYTHPTRYEHQTPKQAWTWSVGMMRGYLPLLLPHLTGKTAEKAQIIHEALKHMHGRGKPQDTEPLRKLYEKIKTLQEPRQQHIYPWDDDRLPFT